MREILIVERKQMADVLKALGIKIPKGHEVVSFGVPSTISNKKVSLENKELVIKIRGVVE